MAEAFRQFLGRCDGVESASVGPPADVPGDLIDRDWDMAVHLTFAS